MDSQEPQDTERPRTVPPGEETLPPSGWRPPVEESSPPSSEATGSEHAVAPAWSRSPLNADEASASSSWGSSASTAYGLPSAPGSTAYGLPSAPGSTAYGLPSAPGSTGQGSPTASAAVPVPKSRLVPILLAVLVALGVGWGVRGMFRAHQTNHLEVAACLPADTELMVSFDARNATADERKQIVSLISAIPAVQVGLTRLSHGSTAEDGLRESEYVLFIALLPEENNPRAATQMVVGTHMRGLHGQREAAERGLKVQHPDWRFHAVQDESETFYVLDGAHPGGYVVRNDWLFFASSTRTLRRMLDAVDGKTPRLADAGTWRAATARLSSQVLVAYAALSTMLGRACESGKADGWTDSVTAETCAGVQYLVAGRMEGGFAAYLGLDAKSHSPLIKAMLAAPKQGAPGGLARWFPQDWSSFAAFDLRYTWEVVRNALVVFPKTRPIGAAAGLGLKLATGIDLEKDVLGVTDNRLAIGADLSDVKKGEVPVLLALGLTDPDRAEKTLHRVLELAHVSAEDGQLAIGRLPPISWRFVRTPQPALLVAMGDKDVLGAAVQAAGGKNLSSRVGPDAASVETDHQAWDAVQKWLSEIEIPGQQADVKKVQAFMKGMPPVSGSSICMVEADGLRFRMQGYGSLSQIVLVAAAIAPAVPSLSPDIAVFAR